MVIKGCIKKGKYFDSVSLMIVGREMTQMDGVEDAVVVMGTAENQSILKNAGLYLPDFDDTTDTDLLIAIQAQDEQIADSAIERVEDLFKKLRSQADDRAEFTPKSFEGAMKLLPDANLALISVAGRYAAAEAMRALQQGLHVMIFSDNVSLEDEKRLKTYAAEQGLLVMGPDCGTAILNGVPLAFANAVNRGEIGIVAASGTGLQEVSTIISNQGAGISQALGTGGRDVSEAIGGLMFLQALEALKEDPQTHIIVLVSKPPHASVLDKLATTIRNIEKPVVAVFLGADQATVKKTGALPAQTLEQAALTAVSLAQGKDLHDFRKEHQAIARTIQNEAHNELHKKQSKHRYLRGLYSGGTFCAEAQLIFTDAVGEAYSNVPLNPALHLEDSWHSKAHTIIDFGDDEFTSGRPHPMIDYSLRNRRILEEAKDEEVSVILLDVVLGYGAHPTPGQELAPVIREAKDLAPQLSIICAVTGTENDPQNKNQVMAELERAGAIVMESNASAATLAAEIVQPRR